MKQTFESQADQYWLILKKGESDESKPLVR